MGCGTCGTKTADGTPAGCKSNGTCGTTGCNKLNVYNWLSDMELPHGQKPFDIVEVRFKGSRKEFYRNINNLELSEGDMVAVEGSPGHDIGVVSLQGELVRIQLKRKNFDEGSVEIKNLFRIARPADLQKWEEMKNLEHETMHISRKLALEFGLKMKLSDVEYQGDGKKVTFFYTADERVDFRELIKKLAEKFKTRIEMRQIGMRQEAARLGAVGSCGRELCCSTWLTDFKAVTTTSARYQNLSLNPLKLAGQCGKLKCCLNYELDSYMDAVRDFPDTNTALWSQKGMARHIKTDIFKRMMWYAYQLPRVGDGDEAVYTPGGEWIPLSVDRVKAIIELNKQQQKPEDLIDFDDIEEEDYQPDYENVVGQDSITRMDNKGRKKKKKSRKNRNTATAAKNEITDTPAKVSDTPPGNRNNSVQGNQPQRGNTQPGQQNRPPQQGGQRPAAHSGERPPQHGNQRSPQQQGQRPPQQPRPQGGQQNQPQRSDNRPPKQDNAQPQRSNPQQQGNGGKPGSGHLNQPPRPQANPGGAPPRQRIIPPSGDMDNDSNNK